ncbi:MAG: universal stress protein [Rhizobacter sp.]
MSPIKSILVHLDASPRASKRLAITRQLAATHEAHATGLYATSSSFYAMPFALAEASIVGQMAAQLDSDRRNRARDQFATVMSEPGAAVEWSELETDPPIWGMVHQALCTDLLVLGQRETEPDFARDLPADFVESVLIESAKPALIVPHTWAVSSVGSRALVAWNASRESVRALTAALPLLQRAEHVDVVVWQDASTASSPDERGRLEQYLRLHQVPATLHWYGSMPTDAGNALLSLAADMDSDLLVMGCYGHTRARELILGGATRTVLASMTLPVLMAH